MARLFVRANEDNLKYVGTPISATVFTLAAWAKSTDLTVDQMIVGFADDSSATTLWGLVFAGAVAGDPVRAAKLNAGTATNASTTTGYSSGVWHHVCMLTVSATDVRAFIDGGSKGTGVSGAWMAALDRFGVGARVSASPGTELQGEVAEVALWDIALSDADVALLAKGLSPLLMRPNGLVGYWPLLGRHDPEIDLIGGLGLTNDGSVVSPHPRIFYPPPKQITLPSSAVPVTGTMAAIITKATASLAGAQAQTGTLFSTIQRLLFNATGAQTQTGALAGTLQEPTFAGAGTHAGEGTVAATLQRLLFNAVAVMHPSGALAAELREPTFGGTGAQTQTGVLAAMLTKALFNGVSAQTQSGTLAGELQEPTFSGNGTQEIAGTIASVLQKATFTGSGAMTVQGAILAILQPLLFAGIGVEAIPAGLQTYSTLEAMHTKPSHLEPHSMPLKRYEVQLTSKDHPPYEAKDGALWP